MTVRAAYTAAAGHPMPVRIVQLGTESTLRQVLQGRGALIA
jgi:hypothetical protein